MQILMKTKKPQKQRQKTNEIMLFPPKIKKQIRDVTSTHCAIFILKYVIFCTLFYSWVKYPGGSKKKRQPTIFFLFCKKKIRNKNKNRRMKRKQEASEQGTKKKSFTKISTPDIGHQSCAENGRTHTVEKPYKCDICDYCCADGSKLIVHKRKHTGEKPYKCDKCDYCCADGSNLIVHKRVHTGEKPYKCDKCDYCCSQSWALTVHKRTHTGEKPYKCDKCDYCCSASAHLQRHNRSHTGEKPYKCDKCDYCCADSASLTIHKRTHTGEKPYKCDKCDYCCTTSCHLQRHKRTHTSEKLYKCDECDYRCADKTALRIHGRVHTGEKRYKCDLCEKSFAKPTNLKIHKRSHTNEKPYKCDHCSKAFAQTSHRSVHHKMHEEQKKYNFVCAMQDGGTQFATKTDIQCTIRCKTALDLDSHIQRHHTDEGIALKFHSEQKLAEFFDSQKISYDRDWMNRIAFQSCKNIEGSKQSARPDFYLHARSAELGCVFLVGNDEFAHRQTKCEFQRIFNFTNALEQTVEFQGVPIVYVRFNPHFFRKDNKFYDMHIAESHKLLLKTIQNFKDVKHGVNLVYINYDSHNGKLDIFENMEEDSYGQLFQNQVQIISMNHL